MKIVFVLQHFDRRRGGAERYIVGLADYLIQQGHELHVVSFTCHDLLEKIQFHAVDVSGSGVQRMKRFNQDSEKILRSQSFDVIQGFEKTMYMNVFQPHSGVHRASVLQNLKASPNRWLRSLRTIAKRMSSKETFFNQVEDALYTRQPLPVFVALSEMVRGHMRETYNVPDERIRLIYNGTDLQQFRPDDRHSTGKQIREQHGIGDEPVYLFVSLNYRRKGLLCLLQAAALMHQQRPTESFKILIVGRGADNHYRKKAQQLGIGEHVIFAGEKDNIQDYYLAGDVLTLPTFYDPCSLVVFEALASGLPVITTRHNGAGEILSNGEQGWVVDDPENTEALATAMKQYLQSDELLRQRQAAIELASHYPIQRSYQQMESLYREMAADTTRLQEAQA